MFKFRNKNNYHSSSKKPILSEALCNSADATGGDKLTGKSAVTVH